MGSSGSEKDYDKEGSRNTTKESGGRTQDKKQWKEALEPLIAIAKKIPGVELIILVLTFISKLIGWKGLLGVFGGLIAVSGLTYFGLMPAKVIQVLTAEYETKAVILSPKPKYLVMNSITNKEFASSFGFLRPYKKWLEDEGDSKGTDGCIICQYLSEEFESPTTEFDLLLEASPGFEIASRAFIIRPDWYLRELKKNHEKSNSVEFSVPPSSRGDRLFTIISVAGRQKSPVGKCEDFFDFHYK